MSTVCVKVCEECSRQSADPRGWLVLDGLHIRSAKTSEKLVGVEGGLDLCSLGCLLRYITRTVDCATSGLTSTSGLKCPTSSIQPDEEQSHADAESDLVATDQ